MKGDFTRFTHKPRKHYAGVLMQQGRVQIDADWNEQFEIDDHRWRVQTIDTIGECGVPIHAQGFQVSLAHAGGDLSISPGRIYVDGLLCELEEKTTYKTQKHFTGLFSDINPQHCRTDLLYIDVWRRHVTAIEDPGLREVALGGPDTATRLQTIWQVKILPDVGDIDCEAASGAWDDRVAQSKGRMSSRALAVQDPGDPCLVAPGAGYRGLENRLYRVEIHQEGHLGTATFKWSRDNGSLLTRVESFIGGPLSQIQVGSLGHDQVMRLKIGDWVEVFDEDTELTAFEGFTGTLAQITDVDEAQRILSLSKDVSAHDGRPKPRIRRWDQPSDAISTTGPWIDLEDGVQVGFSGGPFRTGDYWLIPARTAIGDVEGFVDAPPHGIEHHFCRLALVGWKEDVPGQFSIEVVPCAPTFPPLTESRVGVGCCLRVEEGPGLGRRIQEAIDEIPEAGGCVCLPPGYHLLEQPILISRRQNITLCGCNGVARLYYLSKRQELEPAITVSESNWITLDGLHLYAVGVPALVAVGQSQKVELLHCQLANVPTRARPFVDNVDFDGFDDDTPLGDCFTLRDFILTRLGTRDLQVNRITSGERGLWFDTNGVQIDLPTPSSEVRLKGASYTLAEPLEITALNIHRTVVDRISMPTESEVNTVTLSGEGIVNVVVKGGGGEGVLLGIDLKGEQGPERETFGSPCVLVQGQTKGLSLHYCNLLGGIGVLGIPQLTPTGPSREHIWPRPIPSKSDVWRLVVDHCKVRARFAGVFVRQARGLSVHKSEIAGLPGEVWDELAEFAKKVGPGKIPELEKGLISIFYGEVDPSADLPMGVSTMTATHLEIEESIIWAHVGVLGQAVQWARVERSHLSGVEGIALINSSKVTIDGNGIVADLHGVLGSELMEDWKIRHNRIESRRGIFLVPGRQGQETIANAFEAVVLGKGAFSRGVDALYMTEVVYQEIGKSLHNRLQTLHADLIEKYGTLRTISWAKGIAVNGNTILAIDVGIGVEQGVRSVDVVVQDNLVANARVAGIRLHGTPAEVGSSMQANTGAHRVEGNRLRVSGIGISAETFGTHVIGNYVFVAGRLSKPPKPVDIGLIAAVAKVADYTDHAAKSGDVWMMRDGLSEVSHRIVRGDLSETEGNALSKLLTEKISAVTKDAGYKDTPLIVNATAEALADRNYTLAHDYLDAAIEKIVYAIGSVGIRLAANDTAAQENIVRAIGTARGGILLDMPAGEKWTEDLPKRIDWGVYATEMAWKGGISHWKAGNNPSSALGIRGGAPNAVFERRTEISWDVADLPRALVLVENLYKSGLPLSNVTVRENDIQGGIGHGVEIRWSSSALNVSENRISQMGGNGITTSSSVRLTDVEISRNLVAECLLARAGILLHGSSQSQEWRVIDNAVHSCGVESDGPAHGIELAQAFDITFSRNTIANSGALHGNNGGGVLLHDISRCAQVSDNRFVNNRGRALSIYEFAHQLIVTGNCFFGVPFGQRYLISIKDMVHEDNHLGSLIFSHNQINYKAKSADDYAVKIFADKAAITGNIWNEGDGRALAWGLERYAIIGNVTRAPYFMDDTETDPEREVDHNVPRPTDEEDDFSLWDIISWG